MDRQMFCRSEVGGCGRPVVVVVDEKLVDAFGVLKTVKHYKKAVHQGEEGDRPVVRCAYRMLVRHRRVLEESCIGRRERGES